MGRGGSGGAVCARQDSVKAKKKIILKKKQQNYGKEIFLCKEQTFPLWEIILMTQIETPGCAERGRGVS